MKLRTCAFVLTQCKFVPGLAGRALSSPCTRIRSAQPALYREPPFPYIEDEECWPVVWASTRTNTLRGLGCMTSAALIGRHATAGPRLRAHQRPECESGSRTCEGHSTRRPQACLSMLDVLAAPC
eukprot:1161454-Pelagomonas_calceolata.AAC.2